MVAAVVLASVALAGAAQPPATPPAVSGRVIFADAPVPGATVTATKGDGRHAVVSDETGAFRFDDLAEGVWLLRVEMRGFVTASRDVTVPFTGAPIAVTLTMRSYDDIVGRHRAAAAPIEPPDGAEAPPADLPGIVNGSVVNGAASPFAQPRAFGNNRPKTPSLYNGAISALFGNSTWNARPYSFSGTQAPPPAYADLQVGFAVGGPLRIPWLIKYGPQTFLAFQHGISHNTTTQTAFMPTPAEREGDLSLSTSAVRDPATGAPFAGNVIPAGRISPQARSLLAYYPLPNVPTSGSGNYEAPIVTATTQDVFQFSLARTVGRRSTFSAALAFQRSAADSVSLFDFVDTTRQSSLTATGNWTRRLSTRTSVRARYQFTRNATAVTPFFANRVNVSGDAGIAGNNQDPANWGPPAVGFPTIADLVDQNFQDATRTAHTAGGEIVLRRGTHTITAGGDAGRSAADVRSQPDPRGTLTFTGAASGDAFADFLLGLPRTSALAVAETATRLRAGVYDAYVSDDWRVQPNLTLNLGVRWEYEAPFTETADRLANLDAAPGFASIDVVTATPSNRSLIAPDRRGIEPRLAASWRPSLGSSFVVRAGYGIYRNLGGYESLALLLAQQPPFSRTFSIPNSSETPLTLANPFPASLPGTPNTVGIDPRLRAAIAHNWQVSAQRELPAALTVTAAYLGTSGRHLVQAFLPNTFPAGAVDPCPACPSGFVFLTSNGTSLRNAAQFTLRRRLHNGLTASVQYTLAKATDDAATFNNKAVTVRSLSIAQDWLDLAAERGPSSFDQRHLLSMQVQYTTGMGVAGGTLDDGFRAALLKDWTIIAQLTAGSALPSTPISFLAVAGTGVVGVRPSLTGVSISPAQKDAYANPAAFTTAAPGTWGDAGRNSIRGPEQFALDASLARALPLGGRFNLECRLAATNVLNRVTFAAFNAIVSSPQFGLPTHANPMRALQASLRLRF